MTAKSGKVFTAARFSLEYGFADVDGKQPLPLTRDTADRPPNDESPAPMKVAGPYIQDAGSS